MSEEEVKVGNVNRTTKKPLPGKAVKAEATATATTAEASGSDSIAELNAKMDSVLKHLQAIDWKMWVYLKANNYID
jgi:hypothetical protein